jgi:hypothetical protein
MGAGRAGCEDSPMTNATERDIGAARREMRRLVGLERHYRCAACDGEHRSWTRMRRCPDCGHALTTAVIRRAALV